MKKHTHILFPTPLWHLYNIELPNGIYEWSLEYEKNEPGVVYTNRLNGYHSPYKDINNFPYIDELQNHLKFLPRFSYGSWWININRKDQFNYDHTHPTSDLAVVWYINVLPNENQLLTFIDPNAHVRDKLLNATNYQTKNDVQPSVANGDILIFPSDVVHRVEPSSSNEPRISFACNLKL